MINFVICEDEKVLATEYKNEIDRFMMKYDNEYRCYVFSGYTKEFFDMAKDPQCFTVYLLDIRTEVGSGIDTARIIREEYDDWTSMIIIITAYNEYRFEIYAKRLMLTNFINKLDRCIEDLRETLEICMKHISAKPYTLSYMHKNIMYNIEYKNIVYIEKEQDSKKCIVHLTNKTSIPYTSSIKDLLEKLDNRFIKVSRSTIINKEQVTQYDTKKNEIKFKNKECITSISRDYKRKLIENVSTFS